MFPIPDNLRVISQDNYRVVTPQQATKGYVVLIGNHGSWVGAELTTESRPFEFVGKTADGNYIVREPALESER